MSGSIQSKNYVPGVSGWKLEKDGTFEINACILGSAAPAPERQMVSVEVASWSKYDLPKNAANLLQFMQAELQKVPDQYRHAAEFEEFDASYGDESFNARLFLSYSRLETEEELADRLEKAKVAGSQISMKHGVLTFTHDGVVRLKIGKLNQPEPEKNQPFKVDGDQVSINKAFIQDGTITNAKIGAGLYAAGIGLGIESQFIVSADKFCVNGMCDGDDALTEAIKDWQPGAALKAGGVSAFLDQCTGKIGETKRGQDLKEQVDLLGSSLADHVKAVIRKELMPGGLLHRSR